METATVVIKDEVNVTVIGPSSRTHKKISDALAIKDKKAFFSPLYKMGRWDGLIRYYSLQGETFLYLLKPLLKTLKSLGVRFDIVDNRESFITRPARIDEKFLSDWTMIGTDSPIILRDYQVDAVNTLIDSTQGICLAGTGAGKTLMTAALVRAFDLIGKRVLVIVPDGLLVRQTKAEIINVDLETGEYSGNEKTPERTHVVTTWQALKNNPMIVTDFDCVVVDECHGLKAKILKELLIKYCRNLPFRYGLTGTIPKDANDEMAIHVAVGDVVCEIPVHLLIERGVLAKIHIHMSCLEEDLTWQYHAHINEVDALGLPRYDYKLFKESYFGDYSAETAYLYSVAERTAWIAGYIQHLREQGKGNTLVLVNGVDKSREIASMIPGAYVVNGTDAKKISERQEIYSKFAESDDIVAVATAKVASTGINIPRIFHIVLVDIGASFTRVMQGIGRGTRKAFDKSEVHIHDLYSDLKYSTKHAKARIKYYKEARYPFDMKLIRYTIKETEKEI